MKLNDFQFTEAAFIFEKESSGFPSNYQKQIVAESELNKYSPKELRQIIVNGLNSGIIINENERVSGYWALSKIGNKDLTQNFQIWLKNEIEHKNKIAAFQLLIALDRLDEPVFHKNRQGRSVDETDLNFRDAQQYLNKKTVHNNGYHK